MNYRLEGPVIIVPGKQSADTALRLYKSFPKSSIFYSLNDKVLKICFNSYRGIIVVGAMGIVIRKIAPFLTDKYNDPAVVAVDTEGKFAISMVSGHLGGANILAKKTADILDATPVITTTSDLRGLITPDYLASKWDLIPEYYNNNTKVLLNINSSIIKGKNINWEIESPYFEKLKKDLDNNPNFNLIEAPKFQKSDSPTVIVSDKAQIPGFFSLSLRPRSIIAGIGCRRGTPFENILTNLEEVLYKANISKLSLYALTSIKHKRCELGLIIAARFLGLPLIFYEPYELHEYQKEAEDSKFVKKTIGVGGVCEPTAKKAAGKKNSVIIGKTISKCKNVTTALVRAPWPLSGLDQEQNLH